MPVVLLVEDELVLRESMARALQRLPGVQVVQAARLSEARAALAAEAPAIVVSDINLPDGSGVDLLTDLEKSARAIPVLFVSAWLGSFRDQIPTRDDIEVFEKPLPTETLRAKVMQHLERSRAKAPAPFSVADYLQLAAMGRHSTLLRLSRRRNQVGWLRVVGGEVWAAHFEGQNGEEAASRAVVDADLQVEVEPWVGEPGERNVHQSIDFLLLEAFRQHDEANRDAEAAGEAGGNGGDSLDISEDPGDDAPGAPLPPPPLPPQNVEARVNSLLDEGLDALLSRDYETAWKVFTEADRLKPGNPVVTANIARIRQLGLNPEGS